MRRVYKNLCPATISASIMAANMWKNGLKDVESDNNKILYETLPIFFIAKRYLRTFRISLVFQEPISVSQKKGVRKLNRNKNRFAVVKNTTL